MGGEIKFVSSLLLLSLFVIAIIGYGTNFGVDNNANTTINSLDDGFADLNTNIRSNVSRYRVEVGNSSEGFFESFLPFSATSTDSTSVTGGEFKLGIKSLTNSIKTTFRVINKNIFGNDTNLGIFFTGLGAFLVFLAIRYIWKTWKGGNPN